MGKVRRVLRCYNCGAVLQSKKVSEKDMFQQNYLMVIQGIAKSCTAKSVLMK